MRDAIDKFLGAATAENGPFGLLGIAPEQCTNAAVIAALERQLDRIDQHPHGDTPEAEEVRLALHAAAAQLLDPIVRRHLLHRVRPELSAEDFHQEPLSAPASPGLAAAPRAVGGLEQDAILTMARFGGINPQSMRRLAALAHARGLDASHAANALQHLARRRPMNVAHSPAAESGTTESAGAPHAPVSPGTAWVIAEARRKRAWQAAIVGGLLMLSLLSLLLLTGLIVRHTSRPIAAGEPILPSPAPHEQPSPPKKSPSVASADQNPPPEERRQREPRLIPPGPQLLEALRAARVRLDAEPQAALDDLALAVRSLAAGWPVLDEGARRAAHHSLLEFLYASLPWPDIHEGAVALIAAPARRLSADEPALEAQDVAPAVWAVGVLARLTGERELPVKTTTSVRRALTDSIGLNLDAATFENGARAASSRVPLAIVRPERTSASADAALEAVKAWIDVASALQYGEAERERVLVDGLEAILIDAAEPSSDPRVLTAVRALAGAIAFSPGGSARPRLVDWFRHPRISADDLAEVTAALAAGAVEGVDSVMILSRSAGRDDRLAMATTYAQAWGMEQAALADSLAQEWIEIARKVLRDEPRSQDSIEHLSRALRLAMLNEVARRMWRGERDGLSAVLQTAAAADQQPPPNTLFQGRTYDDSSLGTDGRWALEYRAARQNIPVRLDLLDRLGRVGGAIGPIDAEVLAEEAFFGTPTDRIRPRAQEIILLFADDPAMVLAVLEVLPRRRTILPDMARMVASMAGERLGAHEDPLWPLRARRALVQRSLELLAPESSFGRVDPLVVALSSSYASRAGAGGGGAGGSGMLMRPSAAAEQLVIAARDLWEVLVVEADGVVAHDEGPIERAMIERRRRGRQALARGPIQLFVAEQISVAELFSWTVAGEQRSRAADVRAIINTMTRRRQAADHVFEQVEAAERGMLQIWLVRFGEEVSP